MIWSHEKKFIIKMWCQRILYVCNLKEHEYIRCIRIRLYGKANHEYIREFIEVLKIEAYIGTMCPYYHIYVYRLYGVWAEILLNKEVHVLL